MNEWASESYKELDFVCEAKNLLRIAGAMRRSGLDVIIPELVPEFTRTKASFRFDRVGVRRGGGG